MSEEKEQVTSDKKAETKKENIMATQKLSEKEKPKQQVIYFGPPLKNLQQYQVFKGELPDHVKRYITLQPIIQNLFIEPKDLPLVQRNIGIKGTKEYQLYQLAFGVQKGGILNEQL
ncbi:MAG: hypothetical protein ABS938_00200 [Psychrobacillus psychrodurans]